MDLRRAVTDLRQNAGRSIAHKLKLSYAIIITVMLVIPVTTIASSLVQSSRYDRMISNVSNANRLNLIVKTEISNELWDVVAGTKKFEEGRQYVILSDIGERLYELIASTEGTKSQQLLVVASRSMETLTAYVDRLRLQERFRYPVSENEKILEEIRGVSALVSDLLQDFIVLEIQSAERTNERIKATVWILALFQSLTVLAVTLFSVFAQRSVTRSIKRPIKELETLSMRIASGDLDARAESPRVAELDNLTENLNRMAAKLRELIEENIREQRNLQKSEMKALQAQITPHFLYNTLDTIIWLAEGQRYDSVIDVTRAFSNFFRVSLSRGQEWITVEEEVSHVRSYLTIQKIRYSDILDYEIDLDERVRGCAVLKLLLQPLVENALYHGIKNRRGRGKLAVRAWKEGENVAFSVSDNGIGIRPERLADILDQIGADAEPGAKGDVYGLYNVNKRLRLYYGGEARLSIESVPDEGTRVSFSVPEVVQNV
jgi:two-component system sensor histidine kinase YesM